jgi:hypothetical protein
MDRKLTCLPNLLVTYFLAQPSQARQALRGKSLSDLRQTKLTDPMFNFCRDCEKLEATADNSCLQEG